MGTRSPSFESNLLWNIRWGVSSAIEESLKGIDLKPLIKEAIKEGTIEYLKSKEDK